MICDGCGRNREVDQEHIFNRGVKGANGCDCPCNRVKLCRECHSLAHAKGKETFYTVIFPHLRHLWERAREHYLARCRGETECASRKTRRVHG